MTDMRNTEQLLLITGATGFIGRHVLARLLTTGKRCAALVRGPGARDRLSAALADAGVDAAPMLRQGQLEVIEGDLATRPPRLPGIAAVVHSAACTRFQADATGDPVATNVQGTRRLLGWMTDSGIGQLHLVSTAYVSGTATRAEERRAAEPPPFHNDYEMSKWTSEAMCSEWAAAPGRSLTIHRPSIVVGEHATGRASKFDGFYVSVRAAQLLGRAMAKGNGGEVRVKGNPLGRQNIVPVDYVAAMIAGSACDPATHGRIYHLVNPNPPANELLRDVLTRRFGIHGCRFVPPAEYPRSGLTPLERLFRQAARAVEHYLCDTPEFDRSNVAALERRLGLSCPGYAAPAIERLVDFATSAWERKAHEQAPTSTPCARYFEQFLPEHIGRSKVARAAAMDAAVRFIIDDEPEGQWVCRFERGTLVQVLRGPGGIREDFGYRASSDGFWNVISGRVHPQELFLTGRAEVFGNVENALKMAMILSAFSREFPCSPGMMEGRTTCEAR